MSKKKSKKPAPVPGQVKDDSLRSLEEKIQNDIRSMYHKNGIIKRMDRNAIKYRYLAIHPKESEFIRQVVNSYTGSLNKRGAGEISGVAEQRSNGLGEQSNGPRKQSKGKGKDISHQTDDHTTLLPYLFGNFAEAPVLDDSDPDRNIDQEERNTAILQDFKDCLSVNGGESSHGPANAYCSSSTVPPLEQQMRLLNLNGREDWCDNGQSSPNPEEAVLLSSAVKHVGYNMPPQFALLGHLTSPPAVALRDPRVMLNTNVPFSAFICGLQGSGKSHTTSCIIENCTLSSSALGTLKNPLSTLVLHFNEYSSNVSSQPSEAAFIASVMPEYSLLQSPVPVTVLVSPSNLHTLQKMYSQIPNVQVRAFRLQSRHLNISAMLALMSLGKNESMPLYMAQVRRVLREMAMSNGASFNYLDFRSRLNSLNLDRTQTQFLDQRLELLDSFLDLEGKNDGNYFVNGGITILDLSCPFVDRSTACILFRIAIDLFLHDHPSRGNVIVADEAHKYITDSSAANALTETFLNIVRQQRHLGVRLLISTQEPTVSPQLIDLCSIIIIHRFSSPEWYRVVQKHIALDKEGEDGGSQDGMHRISSLRTGEALVFAPSAYLLDENQSMVEVRHSTFKMVIRKRVTWDGGRTVLCVR